MSATELPVVSDINTLGRTLCVVSCWRHSQVTTRPCDSVFSLSVAWRSYRGCSQFVWSYSLRGSSGYSTRDSRDVYMPERHAIFHTDHGSCARASVSLCLMTRSRADQYVGSSQQNHTAPHVQRLPETLLRVCCNMSTILCWGASKRVLSFQSLRACMDVLPALGDPM